MTTVSIFVLGCIISALVVFFPEIVSLSKFLAKPFLKTEETKFTDELVDLVCMYLSSPVGWEHETTGLFRFVHKKLGISIWVANKDYGIDLRIDGKTIELDDKQKLRIWTEYSKLKEQASLVENKLLIEDLATKALDFYGNLKYKDKI